MKKTLKDLTDKHSLPSNLIKSCLHTALDILDEVINKEALTIKDIQVLVERVIVYRDGCFDIYLKHGLGELAKYSISNEKKFLKLQITIGVIELLEKNTTEYTSFKYLANTLKDMGCPSIKRSLIHI